MLVKEIVVQCIWVVVVGFNMFFYVQMVLIFVVVIFCNYIDLMVIYFGVQFIINCVCNEIFIRSRSVSNIDDDILIIFRYGYVFEYGCEE